VVSPLGDPRTGREASTIERSLITDWSLLMIRTSFMSPERVPNATLFEVAAAALPMLAGRSRRHAGRCGTMAVRRNPLGRRVELLMLKRFGVTDGESYYVPPPLGELPTR
jgi:hypothetical protein